MPPRKRSVTPAGYAALLALGVLVLYLLTPSTTPLGLLPSSWRSSPYPESPLDGWTAMQDDTQDDAPLPPLPAAYAAHLPALVLPPGLTSDPQHTALARRLHAFLSRPLRTYAAAAAHNDAGCPRELADKLVNPDQYNGDSDFWKDMTVDELARRRADVVRWLAEAVERGDPVLGRDGVTGSGQGIVLTGGNQDTTLRTITTIKHLRRLGVTLPIEVFHFSDELHDQNHRDEIENLGATLREATGLDKVAGVWKNWQIKGVALVQSSFNEIIYLDSDNTPLRSPAHLFSSDIYTTSGHAVFWPDLSKDHPDNAIWRLVGDTCALDLFTFESGQIVLSKSGNDGLNLAALHIAAGMMRDRDFWFRMCGGDKDTFRWSWRMLGIDFGVSPRWMGSVGIKNAFQGGKFCGHSVLQYDLVTPPGFTRPPPLFVHSNLLKHLGGAGLRKGQGNLFQQIRRLSTDYVSSPSLNYAHSFVYHGTARGMCLDLGWHDDTPQEVREDVWIETIDTDDEEGAVFAGFEESWWEEGGRVGGW